MDSMSHAKKSLGWFLTDFHMNNFAPCMLFSSSSWKLDLWQPHHAPRSWDKLVVDRKILPGQYLHGVQPGVILAYLLSPSSSCQPLYVSLFLEFPFLPPSLLKCNSFLFMIQTNCVPHLILGTGSVFTYLKTHTRLNKVSSY